MSSKAQGVKVSVLKDHTFRGTEYKAGSSYTVDGDEAQTAEQYIDTLRATGLARPADEEGQGPNIVNEVSGVDEKDARAKTAVQPLTTENFVKPAEPAAAKPAAAPASTTAKPVTTKPVAARVAKAPKAPKASKPASTGGKRK